MFHSEDGIVKEFDGNLALVNLVLAKEIGEERRHSLERCNDMREMTRDY